MNKIKPDELDSYLNVILEISREAGEKILAIYETDFTVQTKGDNSPLTAADMAAHEFICQRLTNLNPAIPILSEESAGIGFSERNRWSQYWLVDPLDGTREFIKRNGEFSVNIALIEDHQSILGVVHIPVSGVSYAACVNNGAFRYNELNTPTRISVKQTKRNRITIAGSRSHGNAKLSAFIGKLDDPTVLSVGSSLKLCLVAEGKADIYPRFGVTSEWDTAAAQAIVEAAGGVVVDTDFNRLEYNRKASLLNPEFLVIADNQFNWKDYL